METDDFDTLLPAFRPAVYAADSNPLLAGNQMAEVWPGPLTDMYASLTSRFPRRELDFFDKPLEIRVEGLAHLDGFHYPFPGEEYLLRKLISLTRTSFVPRNPANPLFMKALMAAASGDLKSVPRLSETGGGGKLGFLIIGPTGCGKSSFADRVMRLFGSRPWLHTDLNGRRCQWFQLGGIRLKAKRSLRGTLELAVQCIDAQLRTDFYSQRSQTGSSTRYENALTAGLTAHAAPFILIDDIERLLSLPASEAEGILNTLVDIMEFAGIPVVLVGTIRAYKMFERFPTVMQKFSSGGVARFGPVPLGRDFTNFARAMLNRNVSERPLKEAEDFIEQLWLYTFGVRRVTREAVRCALTRHAYEPGVKLDGNLLSAIFDEDLPEYKTSLQLMRQVALGIDPGFESHQQYEDFIPPQAQKKTTEALDVIQEFRAKHNISPRGITEHLTPAVFADLRAKQIAAETRGLTRLENSRAQHGGTGPNESQSESSSAAMQAKPSRASAGKVGQARNGRNTTVVDLSSVRTNRPEPVDPSELR